MPTKRATNASQGMHHILGGARHGVRCRKRRGRSGDQIEGSSTTGGGRTGVLLLSCVYCEQFPPPLAGLTLVTRRARMSPPAAAEPMPVPVPLAAPVPAGAPPVAEPPAVAPPVPVPAPVPAPAAPVEVPAA